MNTPTPPSHQHSTRPFERRSVLATPICALCAALLLVFARPAAAQVTIQIQPQSVTNTVGDNVELYVVATAGTPPLTYQWRSNSVPIAGATSAILVLTNVQLGYSGSVFSVTVSDGQPSSLGSSPATLSVNSTFNPAAGLVMWLPFDDGARNPSAQTAADASGNGNNGALQNFESDSYEWVAGQLEGALFFANTNGLSNNVVLINDAASLNFTNNLAFSISAWVVSTPYYWFQGSLYNSVFTGNREAQGAGIVTKGYGNGGEQFDLDIYPSSGNYFRFLVRDATGTTTAGVSSTTALNTNGVWQHVVATCDVNLGVTNISLYVNGARIGSSAVAFNNLLAGGSPVSIGNRSSSISSGYNSPFVGVIDDVRLYNYALSASDVSALYNAYTPTNPAIYQMEASPIYPGGNLPLAALEGGAPGPVTNLWQFSGANATSTTTNSTLIISNLTAGFNGTATLIVSNASGLAVTNSRSITAASPYPAAAAVMALHPLAFWQLNEPAPALGATAVIHDYVGGNNGVAWSACALGGSGVPNSSYRGFPANYQAATMVASSAGAINVPPFGLTTQTSVTFTAWINLNSTPSGFQGIIFNRGTGAQAGGMDWNSGISYTWNNGTVYNFKSGLVPQIGQWAFAAVSIGTNSTIVYMGTNGVIVTATNRVALVESAPNWNVAGSIYIGEDPYLPPARLFPGSINNVAVFGTALSPDQIQYLYYSAGPLPTIGAVPASVNVSFGQNATLTASSINGLTNLDYVWYIVSAGNVTNSLATGSFTASDVNNTTSVTITNVQAAQDGATVYLAVSNQFGATVSSGTVLNVIQAPTLYSLNPLDDVIYAGGSVTFSVVAAGANLQYQWSTNAHAITGANSPSVTLTALPAGSYTVTCTITNLVGSLSTNASLTVLAAPTTPFPQQVLALHPLGYWKLNEPDDNKYDGNNGQPCHDYISANNGIYTNTVLGQPGYNSADLGFANYDPETSAQFASISTPSAVFGIPGVDFSAGAGTNGEFSVAAWVKGVWSSSAGGAIAAKGRDNNEQFALDTGADGYHYRLWFRDAAGIGYGATSTVLAYDELWHYVVGVCDEANSNIVLYVDGLLAGSAVIAPGAGVMASDAWVPMTIGARSSSVVNQLNRQFSGYINDVAVFTNALTQSQVQQLYWSAGVAPSAALATNLVAVGEHGNATNSISTTGTPALAIQWYYLDNTGATNVLTGQTSPTVVLTDVQTTQGTYQYFAVVTNVYGSATSAAFTLMIQSGAPNIVQDISSVSLYAGLPTTLSVAATGTQPMSYSWLLNDTPVAGATTASYSFNVLPSTNTYQCIVSNVVGVGPGAIATYIGAPPPRDAYAIGLLGLGPVAYWRLNDPHGDGIAYDYVGGYNGVYGANTTNEVPGVPNPPFLGFEDAAAVSMAKVSPVGAGYVTVNGLNLNTNSATLVCWAYPTANEYDPTGLIYLRNANNVFGSQISGPGCLNYTWAAAAATYSYNSGLRVPLNTWSMCALVITPVNAVLYLYNTSGQGSATNNYPNPLQSFNANLCLGADSWTLPNRIFSGKMEEAAIFAYPLSAAQLNQLYAIGSGGLTLSARNVAGNVVVTWPFGTLLQASSLAGPWTPVTGATSPYTNSPSPPQMFYRVAAPTP